MNNGRIPYFFYGLVLMMMSSLAGCEGCNEGPDRLSIVNPGNDLIGVLIDGADENGDFTDNTILIPALTRYDLPFSLLPRSDGSGEVTAFRQGSPPVVVNPIYFRQGLDVVPIQFQSEITLDFTVWVLDVGSAGNTYNNRVNEIADALAYCEEHWLEERMGLRVGDIQVNDVRSDPDAATLRDHEADDDPIAYFDDLASDIGLDPNRINIYLTRKVNGSRHYGGSLSGDDQVAMGMYTSEIDILIHQIGHLFTLESVDGNANFDSQNVAKGIGNLLTRRQYFSEGQVYRCHINATSAINDTYNARSGAYTSFCSDTDNNIECPPLEKRIWADGSFPAN